MPDPLCGLRVRVIPMGCRTNLYESEAICSQFAAAGAVLADEGPFDAAVLMSCSVTAEADRKCRQSIRRMRRDNPGAIIAAAGCWAQDTPTQEACSLGIDLLVGNRLKHRIPALVREMLEAGRVPDEMRIERKDLSVDAGWDDLSLDRPQTRTRGFIKIQDGCDHRCAYCIIPDLRGRPVERSPWDVLEEAGRIALSGCREVVFTGINLGMYGISSGMPLGDLVRRTGAIKGIERIRFGSLEPFALSASLLENLAETPEFCPHLHLPMQSGDEGILKRMLRGYSPDEFVRYAELARGIMGDGIHISTDIIAGFPGESPKAFEATLSMLERVRVGKVHVFPFSSRRGTPAELMDGKVPREEIRSRVGRALEHGTTLLDAFCRGMVGKRVDVLVERSGKGNFEGLSPHFLRVRSRGEAASGDVAGVVVSRTAGGVLEGSL